MPQSIQCLSCIHYDGFWKCDAYSVKIPVEIATGQHDHTRPFPGDHGIQFEPIEAPKK